MIAFASEPILPELPSFVTVIGISSVKDSLVPESDVVTFTNLFEVLCEKLEASKVAVKGALLSTTLVLLFVNTTPSVAVVLPSASTSVNVTLLAVIFLSVAVKVTSCEAPPGVRAFDALNLT